MMTKELFIQQLDKLRNLFFSVAIKLTRNRSDAKDLYQESLARAYANRDRFTVGTNFKAWVTTIMRNCFINNYRKKRTRDRVEKPLAENMDFALQTSVSNDGDSMILLKELKRLLDSLKDNHRIPFKMLTEGYKYKEISEALELPVGTVKSRIYFARKELKQMIDQRYHSLRPMTSIREL